MASLLSALVAKCGAGGPLRPIALIRYTVYDETPLKMGTRTLKGDRAPSKRARLVAPSGQRETEQLQVHNTEYHVAALFYDCARQVPVLVRTELACPLQISDSTVGSVIKRCLEEQHSLPC